jgi:hypothetical protein
MWASWPGARQLPVKLAEVGGRPADRNEPLEQGYEGYSQDRQLDVDHGLNRDGAVEDL